MNDLADFVDGFVESFDFVDVKVDMDGRRATVGLNACAAAPIVANYVPSVR